MTPCIFTGPIYYDPPNQNYDHEQHKAHKNSLISLPYSATLSSFRPAVFLFCCSFSCSGICFFLFVCMLLHFYLLLRDFTPCKNTPAGMPGNLISFHQQPAGAYITPEIYYLSSTL